MMMNAKKHSCKRKSKEGTERQGVGRTAFIEAAFCTQHVSEGLAHCLSLNLDPMKEILKHVFNITESNMRKPRVIELLTQALILNPSNYLLLIMLVITFKLVNHYSKEDVIYLSTRWRR
jgi:hypothetical protein